MMKTLIFLMIFSASFYAIDGHAKGHCSATSRMTVERCYQDYLKTFAIGSEDVSVHLFVQKVKGQISSWNGVETLCHNFDALKQCIGAEIAYDCMNIENFKKLTLAMEDKAPEIYVSHFFTTKYACVGGFKKLQPNYECLKNAGMQCDSGAAIPVDCATQEAMIETSATKIEEECGKDAADFTRTFKTIELCHTLTDCTVCKKQQRNRHRFFLKWV